jgi:hypothetical protein
MKSARVRTSQAIKDGQAAGAWLAETAAHVLLAQYNNRPMTKESQPTTQWAYSWASLRSALGVMADDPDVAAALQALDDAHGDALVEHEDRAWHAAWTLAIGLKTGR